MTEVLLIIPVEIKMLSCYFIYFYFIPFIHGKNIWISLSLTHSSNFLCRCQGAVSGVLLVTPNNIMFDPHRMDPLVQAHGCEEYGIMCPLEEVQSAAIYKEITDAKIREAVPE